MRNSSFNLFLKLIRDGNNLICDGILLYSLTPYNTRTSTFLESFGDILINVSTVPCIIVMNMLDISILFH